MNLLLKVNFTEKKKFVLLIITGFLLCYSGYNSHKRLQNAFLKSVEF